MKNLFFTLTLGLGMMFSGAAFGQEVVAGDTSKMEVKSNPRSNGKKEATREFGTKRAATVQQDNAQKQAKTEDDKAKKKAEKQARKEEKARLKAEKKLAKKNKPKK